MSAGLYVICYFSLSNEQNNYTKSLWPLIYVYAWIKLLTKTGCWLIRELVSEACWEQIPFSDCDLPIPFPPRGNSVILRPPYTVCFTRKIS